MRNQKFEYYMRELNLIKRQNWIENDLYHLVAEMIKAGKNMSRLSLRDVSLRSRSPKVRYSMAYLHFLILSSWMNGLIIQIILPGEV